MQKIPQKISAPVLESWEESICREDLGCASTPPCTVEVQVLPFYDSMLAKIIVHDKTREGAIDKMRSTLGELILEGVTTNLDFQYELLGNADFRNGIFDTGFLETDYSCCRVTGSLCCSKGGPDGDFKGNCLKRPYRKDMRGIVKKNKNPLFRKDSGSNVPSVRKWFISRMC